MNKENKGVSIGIDAAKTGENIYSARKAKGFTQEELSSLVHVTAKTISNWERGVQGFSLESLLFLSKVLDVKIDDLLCY